MHITRTDKDPTQISLKISATAEDLAPIKQQVLQHLSGRVKIPGFRDGKAPLNMVEKNVDQKLLLDEFMEHALNQLYGRAVDQEKLRTAATPKVEVKKFVPFSQLEFEVEVEIIGQITLPNYKNIKIAKKPVNVSAKDVEEVLDALQTRDAQRKEVTSAAKIGDEVVIDFFGKDSKDVPIAGGSGKDYPLILGSNAFIPGFEEHLVGAKSGDKKEFDITFPKDYGLAILQGKKVTFTVDVKKVQRLDKPNIDDAFAAKLGPFKTAAELKVDVKKQVTSEREMQAQRELENELLKKLGEKTKVDIPEKMVEEQIDRIEEEEKRNLSYRNQTWQEHLDSEGLTDKQHHDSKKPEAYERIKIGLALSEISEKENIKVLPEELEIRIQILKGQYKDEAMQGELDKPENRRDILARMYTEKTISKLVEYATSK
jgi:trigger factor